MFHFWPNAFLVASVAAFFDGADVHHLSAQSNDEAKPERKQRVMDLISQFRAEMCGKMRMEHGKKFPSHEACEEFMEGACKPGKDKKMDGDSHEVTTNKGYCSAFFKGARKKAEEQVEQEDKEEAEKAKLAEAPAHAVAAAPIGAPSPAPAPAAAHAPAPAPSTAPASAPSPVPAPHIPGISTGKPHGKIHDNEKYYYAKGGISTDRMHMSEKRKLPEQGYWGNLVEHEDQETATGDWGLESGSAVRSRFRKMCEKQPDNPWCVQRGYGHQHHSSAPRAAALGDVQLVLVALVAICAFQ